MATYDVLYDQRASDELHELSRRDQTSIRAAVERHLFNQPTRVSRTAIKRLDPPVVATYRLRVGEYRVFYDVDDQAAIVHIVAIWRKGRKSTGEVLNDPHDRS